MLHNCTTLRSHPRPPTHCGHPLEISPCRVHNRNEDVIKPGYSVILFKHHAVNSRRLPEDLNWMPILSNGHIALQLLSPNVYKNGLYNGKHGLSHRARLPNYSNVIIPQIQFNGSTTTSFTYRMNHRHGIFETLIRADNSIHIRHQVYAHRYYDRAVVNEIILTRLGSDSGKGEFP